MGSLNMPKERKFDWELKQESSVLWKQVKNKSGQLCVVLNHPLLRGVTSEMIAWWFQHFTNLGITLVDVEGYENTKVPAYWLWHPSDHIEAQLKGNLGENNSPKPGAKIQIKETMQYKKYGFKYPVDNALTIFYCENDGWGMGKIVPFLGRMLSLRISFKDVYENEKIIGVGYHYEVVAGTNKQNFIAKFINKKLVGRFTAEFWEAWITHNVIEVGTFENFLPVLFSQRGDLNNLTYSKSMNPISKDLASERQTGFDQQLFEKRLQGYEQSENAFIYQDEIVKYI
ncbi:MAG: hypothetical protein AAFY45_30605 [Bacteroidota bacterium]